METPKETAIREWQEEAGLPLPEGKWDGVWASSNGKFIGFVLRIPSESDLDLNARDLSSDPDSEVGGVLAWVHPRDLPQHNLRPALLNDVDEVLAKITKWLLRSAVRKAGPVNRLKDWVTLRSGTHVFIDRPINRLVVPKGPEDEEDFEKGVIGDTVQSAGRWLAARWEELESRYGRKGALTAAVAMLATLPVPGNIPAVIAVAEGIRGLHGYFGKECGGEIAGRSGAPQLRAVRVKAGGSCGVGERADLTGCTPQDDGGRKPGSRTSPGRPAQVGAGPGVGNARYQSTVADLARKFPDLVESAGGNEGLVRELNPLKYNSFNHFVMSITGLSLIPHSDKRKRADLARDLKTIWDNPPFTKEDMIEAERAGVQLNIKRSNDLLKKIGVKYSYQELESAALKAGNSLFTSGGKGSLAAKPTGRIVVENVSDLRGRDDGTEVVGDWQYIFFPSKPGKGLDVSTEEWENAPKSWQDKDGLIYTYSAEDEMIHIVRPDRRRR